MTEPVHQPAWSTLESLAAHYAGQELTALFAGDADRVAHHSVQAAGLYLDYAKQRVTPEIMAALRELAEQQGLAEHCHALLYGEVVNETQQRAAWHTALRTPRSAINEGLTCEAVHEVLDQMRGFVAEVRSGEWTGHDGRAITDVVNIGIGGSDLGPRLVCSALADPVAIPRPHFAANVDPAELDDTLAGLDPATTLFVVTSKSFGTVETLANARAARQWLLDCGAGKGDVARHFVAVSTNREAVQAFGIERMFEFWDWVGGRFSMWSAAGLSVALTLGMATFEQLHAGAHAMDRHFLEAPLADNLPVALALVGIWNRNFLDLSGDVVVPYARRLGRFAEWAQQVEMESNGKVISRDGSRVSVATVPAVWGSEGPNAQHAYFQALHQATPAHDVDFILPLPEAGKAGDERERQRVANCLGQSEALMCGRQPLDHDPDDPQESLLAAARSFDGDRPSSTILMNRLDAWHLGALMAAYEHKVFVQGVIWDINSFDQWGVELGKELAAELTQDLAGSTAASHDASTQALLERIRQAGPV